MLFPRIIQRFRRPAVTTASQSAMIAAGWEDYAKKWNPSEFRVLPGSRVEHLGDEWTAEDATEGNVTTYGLAPDVVANFSDYLKRNLLDPYLPVHANEGLEIGPGGGRLTELLIGRTKLLHLADPSETMLKHVMRRFRHARNLSCHHTDSMTLPPLEEGSLDFIIAFDVFVHFEPRLIYWYLRQAERLLKIGGVGVIHYANMLTPLGWRQFELDLSSNLQQRTGYAAFGVMCPEMMSRFLEGLGLQPIVSDAEIIPRDAVAVFRKGTDAR